MRRLIIKELRESWFYVASAAALAAILILLGDPLLFRGWEIPFFLVLVMGLMGLAAYSRELANGTLGFTLSRPVKWWWLYLGKLLAALIGCLLVAIFSACFYMIAVPGLYRPFMSAESLAMGTLALTCVLFLGYAAGFVCSCVLPGVALSLAVLVATLVATLWLSYNAMAIYPGWYPLPTILIALAIACTLCVRTPLVLSSGRRMRLWVMVVAIGFVGMFALAGFIKASGISHRPPFQTAEGMMQSSNESNRIPSPDRQETAYCTRYYGWQGRAAELWIRTSDGRYRRLDTADGLRVIAWTPDSSGLIYVAIQDTGRIITARIARKADGWVPSVIARMPATEQRGTYFQRDSGRDYRWSPSGTKLALFTWQNAERVITVIDLGARTAERIARANTSGLSMMTDSSLTISWWLSDSRFAVLPHNGSVVIVPVPLGEREPPLVGKPVATHRRPVPDQMAQAIHSRELAAIKMMVRENPRLLNTTPSGELERPPLFVAIDEHAVEIAGFLISRGADVKAKDQSGDTPLHLASERGESEIAEILLARGADANATNRKHRTPLFGTASPGPGRERVATLLLAHGADPNARDPRNGRTALHYAAAAGQIDRAKLLLAHRADVNAKDRRGRTPLAVALKNHQQKMIEFLRLRGGR